MKEFKGTKGEWKLNRQYSDEHGKILFITIVDEDNKIVAEAKGHEVVNAECMANAQLIKTATGLLKALQELVLQVKTYSKGHSDTTEYFKSEIEQAEKAINKALGL